MKRNDDTLVGEILLMKLRITHGVQCVYPGETRGDGMEIDPEGVLVGAN